MSGSNTNAGCTFHRIDPTLFLVRDRSARAIGWLQYRRENAHNWYSGKIGLWWFEVGGYVVFKQHSLRLAKRAVSRIHRLGRPGA